ncbi:MAG: hypothetical protein RTV72_01990 [Candidatus Thorarchaeota archaeon]
MELGFIKGSLPINGRCCSTFLIAMLVAAFAATGALFAVPIGVIFGMLLGPIFGPIILFIGSFLIGISGYAGTTATIYGTGAIIVAIIVSFGTIIDTPKEGCGLATFIAMLIGTFVSYGYMQGAIGGYYGSSLTLFIPISLLLSLPAYFVAGVYRMEENNYDISKREISIPFVDGSTTRTVGSIYSQIRGSNKPTITSTDRYSTDRKPLIKDLYAEGTITSDTAFQTFSSEESTPSTPNVSVTTLSEPAGENLRIVVKVTNQGSLSVTAVTVTLDAPDGLEFTQGSTASARLGSVTPNGGYQSAVYFLKPTRCVDDSYGGIVVYRDAYDNSYTLEIPRQRLINICPMLEGTDSAKEIFTDCKYGALERNTAAFKFAGLSSVVFSLAESRLSSLIPAERIEQELENDGYLAYTCVVGKTKYGDSKFAAEIQVSGTSSGGILTLSIYSDDDRILSGFFVDIMDTIREHIEIIEESAQIKPTACSNCGAALNLTNLGEDLIYSCESCGAKGKMPPWFGEFE